MGKNIIHNSPLYYYEERSDEVLEAVDCFNRDSHSLGFKKADLGKQFTFEKRGVFTLIGLHPRSFAFPVLCVSEKTRKVYKFKTDYVLKNLVHNTNVEFSEPNQKPVVQKFDIKKRYQFMEQLVDMVIDDHQKSLIITGEPGTGKTFTVTKQINSAGLKESVDYAVFKGFCTPKALYRALYENQDKLIIFDDCDSVLKNEICSNILKAALDSYERRVIHWRSEKKGDDDLPQEFEFFGKVIFISNMSKRNLDDAIISRSMVIDVTMTMKEKIERMEEILPELTKSKVVGKDSLELLIDLQEDCDNFNIRSLLQIISVRETAKKNKNWKELATYMTTQ